MSLHPDALVEAIAFDLDGTLVDSAPDIQHALNVALVESGLRHFDLDTVRSWIGDGPDVLIARALKAQGLDLADTALRQRLRLAFDRVTLAAPLSRSYVFPGMRELIAEWHSHFPMVVVSNKPTPLSRAVLDAAGLLGYLKDVRGADTVALRKPAPAMLLAAAEHLQLPPGRLLMVGDGPADMLAAQAAGCPAALVAWGYGGHAVPEGVAPWRVARAEQLHAGLAGLVAARTPAPAARMQ